MTTRCDAMAAVLAAAAVCAVCGVVNEEMLQCSGCRQAWYCSRSHQKRHWKHGGHKAACTSVAAASAPPLADTPAAPAQVPVATNVSHGDTGSARCGTEAATAAGAVAGATASGGRNRAWDMTEGNMRGVLVDMAKRGAAVVDNFLSPADVTALVGEAKRLLAEGHLSHASSKIGVSRARAQASSLLLSHVNTS